MEPTIIIGSIGSKGSEMTMHQKDVFGISFVRPVNFIGSFTTGVVQPEGEVMRLNLTNLSGTAPTNEEPIFGKHLQEAASIVKDWVKHP